MYMNHGRMVGVFDWQDAVDANSLYTTEVKQRIAICERRFSVLICTATYILPFSEK
jgi:hypothetical protein